MQQNSNKVSLEDLIKLKKTERPNPEFWNEFDRGMRAKTLQALIKKPSLFARIKSFFSLPQVKILGSVSACALVVLTLTMASIHNKDKSSQSTLLVSTGLDAGSSLNPIGKNFVKNSIHIDSSAPVNFASDLCASGSVNYIAGSLPSYNSGNFKSPNQLYF